MKQRDKQTLLAGVYALIIYYLSHLFKTNKYMLHVLFSYVSKQIIHIYSYVKKTHTFFYVSLSIIGVFVTHIFGAGGLGIIFFYPNNTILLCNKRYKGAKYR